MISNMFCKRLLVESHCCEVMDGDTDPVGMYTVRYEDGDSEELTREELEQAVERYHRCFVLGLRKRR